MHDYLSYYQHGWINYYTHIHVWFNNIFPFYKIVDFPSDFLFSSLGHLVLQAF